jgi:hypothetical protein
MATPRSSREVVLPNNSTNHHTATALNQSTTSIRTTTKPAPTAISFAPSFVPSLRTISPDQVEEAGKDMPQVFLRSSTTTALSSPPVPARRRSRGSAKGGGGTWTKRFATLRNSRANDSVRLQNQAFSRHRHNHAFDLNDPRKRANSYTDVTIVGGGDCTGSASWIHAAAAGVVGEQDSKIAVLAYLHRHVRAGSETKHPPSFQEKELFAWVSFTLATARSINLQKGIQLRLYNAVVVPSRHAVTIDSHATAALGAKGSMECRHVVICTHLCEPYPSGLEPLPPIRGLAPGPDNHAQALNE